LFHDFHSLVPLLLLIVELLIFRKGVFVSDDETLLNKVNIVTLLILSFLNGTFTLRLVFIFDVFALKLSKLLI
jgi:hypothetical protein